MTNLARKNETISLKRVRIEMAVDALGNLNERIAKLQQEAEKHSDFLKTLRPGAYEGEWFRVNIAPCTRVTISQTVVRNYFKLKGLDMRWLNRNCKKTSYRTLTWGAR